MDDPVKEIPTIIHLLTQSPPATQRETIETYFTPDASFTHPFVRTGHWSRSRVLIHLIYRWYKIMSPRIELTVQSVAFDKQNRKLYVQIFQIFRIWLIPFYYAPVKLTTVLTLTHSHYGSSSSSSSAAAAASTDDETSGQRAAKYYIAAQDGLYQTDQFIRFVAPGAWVLVWLFGMVASLVCAVGALAGGSVSWAEERWGRGEGEEWERKKKRWEGLDGWGDREVVERSELKGRVIG